MKAGLIVAAALTTVTLTVPCRAQPLVERTPVLEPDWKIVGSGDEAAVEAEAQAKVVQHVGFTPPQTVSVTHRVRFSCITMTGGWRPSQWGNRRALQMWVSYDVSNPVAPLRARNFEKFVTIVTSTGSFNIAPEEFSPTDDRVSQQPGLPDYESAEIMVSDRLMNVLRNEPTLDVEFGSNGLDSFGIAFALASGRQEILDFASRCK